MRNWQYSQEIRQAQIEIQSITLQRAGEELRDNIGQLLSVARLNLNILEETEQNIENRNYIVQANEMVKHSIKHIRDLTDKLGKDSIHNFRLEDNLSAELLRIRKATAITTDLTVSGEKYRLLQESELILFRISQEIFDNITKHARATVIFVRASYATDQFTLTINANGLGFDEKYSTQNDLQNAGMGLVNVQRRLEMIGGSYTLQSNSIKGTTIEIFLPVDDL